MWLEGTVSNVAQFGAFVDIGVHQDGLIHVSQLADRFVADAREVVRAGAVVKVRVLEVDVQRRRIALSLKAESGEPRSDGDNRFRAAARGERPARREVESPEPGALAAAFARIQGRR